MMDFESDRRFTNRIRRLRRHARWILAGTAMCGLAAGVISLRLPKIYRATTYVLVSTPKVDRQLPQASTSFVFTPNPDWNYGLMNTFLPFIDNDELIARAIQHFHLDREPYTLTVHKFRTRNYLDVQIPQRSRLLEICVEFPDAKLAADIANYVAGTAVEYNNALNTADTAATQKLLKERVDDAASQLAEADARRLAVRERAKIEAKERALTILLAQKERVSSELQQLTLGLTQSESRAQALEQALAGEPRTLQLKKSIDSNRFLERAVEKLQLDGGPALSTSEEALNTTRGELDRQLAAARADAAAQRAGVRSARASLAEVDAEAIGLIGQVTRLRNEIDKAERDFLLAREAYEAASRDYRNASVTVSAKSQDLKQIAPAQIPERPTRPRLFLNVLLALLLGATLLSALAMAMENIREVQASQPRFTPEEEIVGARRS